MAVWCNMQYITRRVYSKRHLFKTLTSVNVARDHHTRIIHRFIELQRQSMRLTCMLTQMTGLLHKVTYFTIVLQIIKLWEGAFIVCNTFLTLNR